MTALQNHLLLMFIYAVCVGLFFALLWKETRAEQVRLFLIIFVSLFVGGVILAWMMYPFPLK